MFTRTRYQYGSLETKERKKGKEVWEFRYYETDGSGRTPAPGRHGRNTGRVSDRIRREEVSCGAGDPIAAQCRTTGCGWCCEVWSRDRTIRAGRNAGTVFNKGCVQVVHQESDQAALGGDALSAVKSMAVEDWLRSLDLAPKTKSHVRSLMHTIFQCAERWELTDKNPDQTGSGEGWDEAPQRRLAS